MSNEVKIIEYQPGLQNVAQLALEQNAAVDSGAAQMLRWQYQEDELRFPHEHPFYIAWCGGVAVGGAGFNIQYQSTNCLELGGAYVTPAARGQGIYHKLTKARIDYVLKAGLELITFANALSAPILKNDFGMRTANELDVPVEAFDLCASCDQNPLKPQPACFAVCCDRETILKL